MSNIKLFTYRPGAMVGSFRMVSRGSMRHDGQETQDHQIVYRFMRDYVAQCPECNTFGALQLRETGEYDQGRPVCTWQLSTHPRVDCEVRAYDGCSFTLACGGGDVVLEPGPFEECECGDPYGHATVEESMPCECGAVWFIARIDREWWAQPYNMSMRG